MSEPSSPAEKRNVRKIRHDDRVEIGLVQTDSPLSTLIGGKIVPVILVACRHPGEDHAERLSHVLGMKVTWRRKKGIFFADGSQPRPDDPCAECGKAEGVELYMITDALWKEAGMSAIAGQLHLRCVEARLDRALRLEDFSEAPVNAAIRWAWTRGREEISAPPEKIS